MIRLAVTLSLLIWLVGCAIEPVKTDEVIQDSFPARQYCRDYPDSVLCNE